MQVIARIPDVSPAAESAGPAVPALARPSRPVVRAPAGVLERVSDAWPTWPVAALAVVAVVTWMLASWNDQARLERQRSEMRLAREPAAVQRMVPTGTSADGAVVR